MPSLAIEALLRWLKKDTKNNEISIKFDDIIESVRSERIALISDMPKTGKTLWDIYDEHFTTQEMKKMLQQEELLKFLAAEGYKSQEMIEFAADRLSKYFSKLKMLNVAKYYRKEFYDFKWHNTDRLERHDILISKLEREIMKENIALPMDLNDDEMAEVESVSFPEQSKDMQSYLKSLDDHEFDEEVKEVFSKILSQSEILQQVAKEKREKEIAKVLDEVFGDQISNLMSDEI